jgi:AcrR family transcriptional regulator
LTVPQAEYPAGLALNRNVREQMSMYDSAMTAPIDSTRTPPPSARVLRRQRRTREALLKAAAAQFCRKGIDAVSVEDLIAEADISRATFYGLFSNKYNLLEDIVNPVFDEMLAALEALGAQPAPEALQSLLALYARLWRTHQDGLRLLSRLAGPAREHFAARYAAVSERILGVLQRAEQADLLRNGSASLSLRLLNGAAVPLLDVYEGQPAGEALFADAMRRLLIRSH